VTGEEGRLYRVNLHGKEYFVKKWHGSHRRMTYANPDTNFSHHSPYEHKMLYYEYKIINTLFPDQTPVLATAYDPRIKKNPQTGAHEFDGKFGKPVRLLDLRKIMTLIQGVTAPYIPLHWLMTQFINCWEQKHSDTRIMELPYR